MENDGDVKIVYLENFQIVTNNKYIINIHNGNIVKRTNEHITYSLGVDLKHDFYYMDGMDELRTSDEYIFLKNLLKEVICGNKHIILLGFYRATVFKIIRGIFRKYIQLACDDDSYFYSYIIAGKTRRIYAPVGFLPNANDIHDIVFDIPKLDFRIFENLSLSEMLFNDVLRDIYKINKSISIFHASDIFVLIVKHS